jgi:hypothetical protein
VASLAKTPNLSNQFRVSGARTDHHEYRDEYRIKRPPEGNCERDQRDRSNLKTECALSSPALTQNQNAVLIAMSFFRPNGTSISEILNPSAEALGYFRKYCSGRRSAPSRPIIRVIRVIRGCSALPWGSKGERRDGGLESAAP